MFGDEGFIAGVEMSGVGVLLLVLRGVCVLEVCAVRGVMLVFELMLESVEIGFLLSGEGAIGVALAAQVNSLGLGEVKFMLLGVSGDGIDGCWLWRVGFGVKGPVISF